MSQCTSSRLMGPQSMDDRISSSSWVMTLLISRNWFSSSTLNFLLRAIAMKVLYCFQHSR